MMHAYSPRPASIALLSAALLLLAALGATGCGSGQGSAGSLSDSTAHPVQGRVFGGQQPVAGATIQLYTAGTPASGGGYGAGATPLILGTLPTTDSNGNFTITGDYLPPSTPSYFYIVSTGGSPGNGNPANPDIVLMAAIAPGSNCAPASSLSSSMFININEVTTAAAALALQPFIAAPTGTAGDPVLIGAPAANNNDLRAAFQTAAHLVSTSSGAVVNSTGSKGPLIDTLADILASCVNSDPASALPNPCSKLLGAATPGGAAHTAADTMQAAWYIAQNPAVNTSPLWLLVPSSPPFVALSSAPASFAVSSPTDSLTCSFAVLGASTVTNTGPTVVKGGDLGVYPGTAITGFPPGIVTAPATAHSADAAAQCGQTNLTAAYDYAQGLTGAADLSGQDLGGLILNPGVYKFSAAAQLTGTLTLDAGADPDAVFVFQIGSTLTTASSSHVSLTNGAQAQNVFWQVGSSATLGTSTSFQGTILAHASITANTGTSIQGRALANSGAIALDSNAITAP